MVTAPEVNITLTLDPAEIDQEYGLFKTTANTYKKNFRYCPQNRNSYREAFTFR